MNTYDESLEWIQLQAQIEANALKEFALRPIPLLTIKSDAVKTEAGTVNFLTVDAPINMEDIVEVVVSEPKQHPRDKSLLYSTVLMVNKKDAYQPFLAIHIREGKTATGAETESTAKRSLKNNGWDADLKEWVLMSRDGSTKRHSIVKNHYPAAQANRRKFIDQER